MASAFMDWVLTMESLLGFVDSKYGSSRGDVVWCDHAWLMLTENNGCAMWVLQYMHGS